MELVGQLVQGDFEVGSPDLKFSMRTLIINMCGLFVVIFTIRIVAWNEDTTLSNLSVLDTNYVAVG